jgi:hypothetical protein
MRLPTKTSLTLVAAAAALAAWSAGLCLAGLMLAPLATRADLDDSADRGNSAVLGSPANPADSSAQLADLNQAPAARPVAAGAAPASQPDRLSAGPASQPGQATGHISYLLTRNLHPSLRERQLLARRDLSATDRSLVEIHSILKASQKTVEDLVAAKKEFDQLAPEVQNSYRDKATLIEQVLKELPPEEQARLLALNPRERAKAIMDLIAQHKARQLLSAPTPPGPTPPK